MTANLFAACKKNEPLAYCRIRLDAITQASVTAMFISQEDEFRKDIDEEIDFNGGWELDGNQIFTIDIPREAEIFEEAITANASSIQDINIANFLEEGIKALFIGIESGASRKVLVQKFKSAQLLQRKFSLLYNGNAFARMTEPAFTLDSGLTCIIEEGKIKFKSHYHLRSIINTRDIYKEATEQEVKDFAQSSFLSVLDIDDFVNKTDQTARKLITSIKRNSILDKFKTEDVVAAAANVGMKIETLQEKIIVPSEKADFKNLLRFLDDSLYRATLTGNLYITNSKKNAEI